LRPSREQMQQAIKRINELQQEIINKADQIECTLIQMTLYDLYKYSQKEIQEVEYLLNQAKKFDILDEVNRRIWRA